MRDDTLHRDMSRAAEEEYCSYFLNTMGTCFTGAIGCNFSYSYTQKLYILLTLVHNVLHRTGIYITVEVRNFPQLGQRLQDLNTTLRIGVGACAF